MISHVGSRSGTTAIWGKLLGGTIGLAIGGPIGLVLGAVAGHGIDRARRTRGKTTRDFRSDRSDYSEQDILNASWVVTFFVLAAKLSKIDGHVARDEIATIKRVLNLPRSADAMMGAVFRQAISDTTDYQSYAKQIAEIFRGRKEVLEQLLGALVLIATCDGHYHPNERTFLAGVAQCFGFSAAELHRIEAGFTTSSSAASAAEIDPYDVLGVSADASDSEVRAAYRKIIKDSHPDVAIAKGMPEEFIELCNRKMANANNAYDTIRAKRGMK